MGDVQPEQMSFETIPSRDVGLASHEDPWVETRVQVSSERIPGVRTGHENPTDTESGAGERGNRCLGNTREAPASTEDRTLCPLPHIPAIPALGRREMARLAALQRMRMAASGTLDRQGEGGDQ